MPRVCIISDTHGSHVGLSVPDADIIIHCGDFSGRGTWKDAVRFIGWYSTLPHKFKVFIAGNHDLVFEQGSPTEIDILIKGLPSNMHYLNDSEVTLEGLKFWGSPAQPIFLNWAFNRTPEQLKHHWSLVPQDTQVLVTHCPPRGILDEAPRYQYHGFENVGCELLLEKIKKVKPVLNCFGHIHNGYGTKQIDNTLFVNASVVNEGYQRVNKPILVDIENGVASLVDIY